MVEITDLMPGMRVKIVDEWNLFTQENLQGGMDKWLGTIMTIHHIDDSLVGVRMVEDGREWIWNKYCIDYIALDPLDFQEAEEDELMEFLLN